MSAKIYSKESRQAKQHVHTCMFCGQSGSEMSNGENERLREVLSECREDLSAAIDRLPPRLSDHADMIHCKELLARIDAALNDQKGE